MSRYTKPMDANPTRHLYIAGLGHALHDTIHDIRTFVQHGYLVKDESGEMSVTNLSDTSPCTTVIEEFQGESIQSIELPPWKGYCFVSYSTTEDAVAARQFLMESSSQQFDGRSLLIRYANLWEEVEEAKNGCMLVGTSDETLPAYYLTAPGKLPCEWGLKCSRKHPRHFLEADHPQDHSLIGQPVPTDVDWNRANICRHFSRLGFCAYGDKCRFQHVLTDSSTAGGCAGDPTVSEAGKDQRKEKPVESNGELNVAAQRREVFAQKAKCQPQRVKWLNRGPGKRNRVRKSNRASAFRRFLLDTFGEERMKQGSGVLDVAGGKGELSFELLNLNGIPTTVVDPRRMKLDKALRRFRNGIYHRSEVFSHYISKASSPEHLTPEEAQIPSHYRCWFVPELWDANRDAATEIWNGRFYQEKIGNYLKEFRANHGDEETLDESDLGTEDMITLPNVDEGSKFAEEREMLAMTMLDCSLVVGMHPDMATEHIVDFALQREKPFAVVPCCVYGNLFPNRFLDDGTSVKSYADFLRYLCNKSDKICHATLDFEGKNTVIYCL